MTVNHSSIRVILLDIPNAITVFARHVLAAWLKATPEAAPSDVLKNAVAFTGFAGVVGHSLSTIAIRSPIHRITGTAIELPIAL